MKTYHAIEMDQTPTNIAIVGTGFVSEMYVKTLPNHPHVKLVGIHDRDGERAQLHSERWSVPSFESLDSLLADSGAEIILNLTNPCSHFEVTRQCLDAGKHVFSEKPLGMTTAEAKELVRLAEEKGLLLAGAPCSWMSEAAETIHHAIESDLIGQVRLAYANFDDGMIAPAMAPWHWRNGAGIPWPAKDEFEVGCTYEHAGYVLSWLCRFFGPVQELTSFASCQIPDKGIPVEQMAPDFTVGCLTFVNNIVARVTCGLIAPRDKSLVIVGDRGIIYVNTVRSDVGPVYHQELPVGGRKAGLERRMNRLRELLEAMLPAIPWSGNDWQLRTKLRLKGSKPQILVSRGKPVDFLRGVSEMAESIQESRPCGVSANFSLHITEVTEKLQFPSQTPDRLETSC